MPDQCSRQKVEINAHVRGWLQRRRPLMRVRRFLPAPIIIALGYCEVKVAIARGPVIPQNRIRSDLRRPEIQKFPGGACPQTPPACALCARVCLPCTVLSLHYPAGPVQMSFRRPAVGPVLYTWNGMEWNGMEWNGMEWNGMDLQSNCT